MRLGFIGFGNMGRALAEGLLRKGALAAEEMGACARDFDKLRRNTQRSGIRAFSRRPRWSTLPTRSSWP